MLITNGNSMWGTVFDTPGKKAMRLNIGDCLTFGSFVPPVDSSDLKIRLPMLWHVIGKDGNRLKLLSYFFFEHTGCWPVEGSTKSVTWENSEIRHDLNNKYLYDCFDENERIAILTTEVKTKSTGESYIVTRDKLYVLGFEDIENIPEHLKIGRCLFTDSADDGSSFVDLMYCFYWLRDPGEYEDENLVVQGFANSKLVLDSLDYGSDEVGVRAIMWVDAEKIKEINL